MTTEEEKGRCLEEETEQPRPSPGRKAQTGRAQEWEMCAGNKDITRAWLLAPLAQPR